MNILEKTKVGKIVASNFSTSKVLTAHGIDFCCNGGVTLEEACKNKGVSVSQVLNELEESFKVPNSFDYEQMELGELIQTILNVHHKYVRSTVPALQAYLSKLCEVHGERHSELYEIKDLFYGAADALEAHMNKEEAILFPYVQAMIEAQTNHFPLSKPHFDNIDNPIKMMEEEHQTEGDRFRKIAQLSDNYNSPKDGCQTYWVTYALLQEFENDLHKHIHLENNILFPRARKMFDEFDFQSTT